MKNENMVNLVEQVEQAKRIENWNQVRDELMNALNHLYYINAPYEQIWKFIFYIHDLYESMDKALKVAKAVQKLTLEQLESYKGVA